MTDRVVISEWKKRPKGGKPMSSDSIHPAYLYNLTPGQKLIEVVDKDKGISLTKHIVVGL